MISKRHAEEGGNNRHSLNISAVKWSNWEDAFLSLFLFSKHDREVYD